MGTPASNFKNIISIFVFLAALAVFCSAETNIIKGTKATNGQFPFMALVTASTKIRGRNVSRQCGGVIYNNQWIITAAQCTSFAVNKPRIVKVYVGDVKTSSMQALDVSRVVIDDRFKANSYEYDIALLNLAKPLKFNSQMSAIKLSTKPASKGTYYTAGWGVSDITRTARSKDLYYIKQEYSAPANCEKIFTERKEVFSPTTQFCTKGGNAENVCAGDSGGPLFQTSNINQAKNAVLYGLVSYGKGIRCKSPFNANIRIDAFSCWIGQTIEGNSKFCDDL